MVDSKNVEINDSDVVVLFRKTFVEKKQQIMFKPFSVVKGNMEYNEYMFIDDTNNGYHHLYHDFPGNAFAFRKNLIDLENEYKTNDFEVIKEKYLEDVDKYYYYASRGLRVDDYITIVKENKETHDISELDDFDFEEYDAIKNGVTYTHGNISENVHVIKDNNKIKSKDKSFDFVPYQLALDVKEKVIAQDRAIEDIVVNIWNNLHLKYNHNNILVIGNTGVGKTEIFRSIANKLNVPFYSTSMASMSKTGFVGDSVNDILSDLIMSCDGDLSKAENAIVFLDEIDKIAKTGNEHDHISCAGVQDELLKVMEDGKFFVRLGNDLIGEKVLLDTSKITFIGAGAFDGIFDIISTKQIGFNNKNTNDMKSYKKITQEHLVKYGFKPEFIGRMPIIISLEDLTKDDLITIMKSSKNNILEDQIKVFTNMGYEVKINDDVFEEIALNAISKKIGARGLNSAINNLFSRALFVATNPNNHFNYIEITKETVHNPEHFKIGYKTVASKYVPKRKLYK